MVKSCFACTTFNCPYHPDYNGQPVPLELECDKMEYYTNRAEFMDKYVNKQSRVLDDDSQIVFDVDPNYNPPELTKEEIEDIDALAKSSLTEEIKKFIKDTRKFLCERYHYPK